MGVPYSMDTAWKKVGTRTKSPEQLKATQPGGLGYIDEYIYTTRLYGAYNNKFYGCLLNNQYNGK